MNLGSVDRKFCCNNGVNNTFAFGETSISLNQVGYYLSEKEAEAIVDDVGKHWSKEQTDQFRGSHDANDFYAGLNLIYSIFRKDKYSTTDYVELTNAFIEVDDRLIKYYYFVV